MDSASGLKWLPVRMTGYQDDEGLGLEASGKIARDGFRWIGVHLQDDK